ncbi:sensor domain-containing diguanylate cyclase [Aliivibrio logei]|uniref:diguanylate cyclase n=2 Tax=Aliivibrio logei TaxID=688 RepID=A0A1B9P4P8_ALILO|nr:sensor domain-containing diguanylate cyclase [Aliivibrio logei]OCH23873.1 diguanylate cyclase [Aliivibrio logei]OEF16260.1 diguanylate cyclase [Aliivibrio logei 5S-186]
MTAFFTSHFDSQDNIIDLSKWQELADLIVDIFGADCGAVIEFTGHSFHTLISSNNKTNFLRQGSEWPSDSKSFCRAIVETGKELYVPDALKNEYWINAPAVEDGPVRSYCGVPVFHPDGSIYGTICAIDTKHTNYKSALVKLLHHLSKLITADLKMAEEAEQHRQMALTDSMTGLLNRRGLDILGKQKLKDSKRYQDNIGILYFDIDNLKQVNDNHGHEFGDQCIQLLADILKSTIRESDLTARTGGDEFIALALLNKENDNELALLAEQIRQRYQEKTMHQPGLNLTNISIGRHLEPYDSVLSLKDMFINADTAMYKEKDQKKSINE